MNLQYGFIRVGAVVPKLKLGNVKENVLELYTLFKEAEEKGVQMVVSPELSLTGYTCGDMFAQAMLLNQCEDGLQQLLEMTKDFSLVMMVGLPLAWHDQLYNCAVIIQKGKILGIVPKTYLPNAHEFYEKRWFVSSKMLQADEITLCGQPVPIGCDLLFENAPYHVTFGVEICEDLWVPCPPSLGYTTSGAEVIFNLSASNEIVGKYAYRKNLIANHAAKTMSSYVYASSGMFESTTDLVFSGHALICEAGSILKENQRFDTESNLIYEDIDIEKLRHDRVQNPGYSASNNNQHYRRIVFALKDQNHDFEREYAEYPFVPTDFRKQQDRAEEILEIQATGLARRLDYLGMSKVVIGISGGLDSTLAFLVIRRAYQKLKLDPKGIICVTMPGFGTSDRTKKNAITLVEQAGATLREIPITKACTVHLQDIGLSLDDRSVAYENAQARERTQILMDLANLEQAIVIGTGDLSELALGWCTYNGDHMSMYGVNSSIPKTLVRTLVQAAASSDESLKAVLTDILDTPISPELLPPQAGQISQLTEKSVGPYVLHDFFLYHFLRNGASFSKIYFLACHVFADKFSKEEIKKWLEVFIKRFFTQQFKRSCLPDGPKVGTISLSPRGDLRLPSDMDFTGWKTIEEEKKK